MGKVEKFEDLRVWQDSMDIAVDVYRLFDPDRTKYNYALKDQLMRASLGISNNIAEGFEYNNNNDFIRFLRYAKGSTGEVRSMFHFLSRVDLISDEEFVEQEQKLISLSKQQSAFISYLKGRR